MHFEVRNSTNSRESARLERVGGIYEVGRKLGSGSFGKIYYAVNVETGEDVAVKVELKKGRQRFNSSQLAQEVTVIKDMQGATGFVDFFWSGMEDTSTVMVMELLGPSLEDLFRMQDRQFELRTVLMIADQVLRRIEVLHSKNFLHRDIKPENFCIGGGRKSNVIYLIDFGLAKKYCFTNCRHIPYRENRSLTGTARYASINDHLGVEQSRRDDLLAIGYMLVYFLKGRLPWMGLFGETKEAKYQKMLECKRDTSIESLCEGLPPVFAKYLRYCTDLGFEDQPDYALLKKRFRDYYMANTESQNGVFEWDERLKEQPLRISAKSLDREMESTAPGREKSWVSTEQTQQTGRWWWRTKSTRSIDIPGAWKKTPASEGEEAKEPVRMKGAVDKRAVIGALFGCCARTTVKL